MENPPLSYCTYAVKSKLVRDFIGQNYCRFADECSLTINIKCATDLQKKRGKTKPT